MLAWRFVPITVHWRHGCGRVHSSSPLCEASKGAQPEPTVFCLIILVLFLCFYSIGPLLFWHERCGKYSGRSTLFAFSCSSFESPVLCLCVHFGGSNRQTSTDSRLEFQICDCMSYWRTMYIFLSFLKLAKRKYFRKRDIYCTPF